MRISSIGTVLLSVLLSAATAVLIVDHQSSQTPAVLQAKKIELLDDDGKVRGTLAMVVVDDRQQPQLSLIGTDGRQPIILSINETGEGTIFFNSSEIKGKVALGYIWDSDMPPPDQPDPFAYWGLRVLGTNGKTQALGADSTGHLIPPSH